MTELKKILDAKGLRRRWVAKRIGVCYQYLSEIENGKVTPGPEFKRKMAELLDLPQDILFPEPMISISTGWVDEIEQVEKEIANA